MTFYNNNLKHFGIFQFDTKKAKITNDSYVYSVGAEDKDEYYIAKNVAANYANTFVLPFPLPSLDCGSVLTLTKPEVDKYVEDKFKENDELYERYKQLVNWYNDMDSWLSMLSLNIRRVDTLINKTTYCEKINFNLINSIAIAVKITKSDNNFEIGILDKSNVNGAFTLAMTIEIINKQAFIINQTKSIVEITDLLSKVHRRLLM
jgi:hypothetical protein